MNTIFHHASSTIVPRRTTPQKKYDEQATINAGWPILEIQHRSAASLSYTLLGLKAFELDLFDHLGLFHRARRRHFFDAGGSISVVDRVDQRIARLDKLTNHNRNDSPNSLLFCDYSSFLHHHYSRSMIPLRSVHSSAAFFGGTAVVDLQRRCKYVDTDHNNHQRPPVLFVSLQTKPLKKRI